MAETTLIEENANGHRWVRYDTGTELDDVAWCIDCGTNRVEVPDWQTDPDCPMALQDSPVGDSRDLIVRGLVTEARRLMAAREQWRGDARRLQEALTTMRTQVMDVMDELKRTFLRTG